MRPSPLKSSVRDQPTKARRGIAFYHKALALDPNYVEAREYLGEGYLKQGALDKAKGQLAEIAQRCGTTCETYAELSRQISEFEAQASKG